MALLQIVLNKNLTKVSSLLSLLTPCWAKNLVEKKVHEKGPHFQIPMYMGLLLQGSRKSEKVLYSA